MASASSPTIFGTGLDIDRGTCTVLQLLHKALGRHWGSNLGNYTRKLDAVQCEARLRGNRLNEGADTGSEAFLAEVRVLVESKI
jgi:hypothetical protein